MGLGIIYHVFCHRILQLTTFLISSNPSILSKPLGVVFICCYSSIPKYDLSKVGVSFYPERQQPEIPFFKQRYTDSGYTEHLNLLDFSIGGVHFHAVFDTGARYIISFFIIRIILKATQDVIVNAYGLPILCFIAFFLCLSRNNTRPDSELSDNTFYSLAITTSFIIDIGSMFLLTWFVETLYEVLSLAAIFCSKNKCRLT